MKSSIKQIYVSLEMSEKEVKILISEFFNTRFNVIKLERVPVEGIDDFKVVNKEAIIEAIKKARSDIEEKVGARIESAILLIPAYNFKRIPLKVSIIPEKQRVSKEDVVRAISNSLKTKVDKDVMIINPVLVKYTTNGISSRKLPEGEICDELIVDIDLLCADKEMTYSYVSLLEESGIKVEDICLNSYAICKEAALIERSLNQSIILLDISESLTYLTLLSKGKLVSTEVIFDGIGSFYEAVWQKYKMPMQSIARLVKYNVCYDQEYNDDAIFAWKVNDTNYSINHQDISNTVKAPLDAYVDKIVAMCKPVIEKGNTSIIVTGEGAEMEALIKALANETGVDVKAYFPDTIGVRDSSLTALYGSFFVYREKALLYNKNVTCVDMLEYDKVVDHQKLDVEGETLTSKIKNLFKQYRNKGDI